MKKIFKLLVACSMVFTLVACGGSKGSDTIKGTYSIYVEGFDWGCGTTKATLTLDYVLDAVKAEDFVVKEVKAATDWADPEFAVKEQTFDRTVTKAYLTDDEGKETTEPSKTVTLELAVDPNTGSPMNYSVVTGVNTWCDPYYLTIELADGAKLASDGTEVKSFTIDTAYTARTTNADNFKQETFKATDGTEYAYAHYKVDGAKTLFVWLHGGGEGGTDPYMPLLANRVTAFTEEEFQSSFDTGVSVLVPQTPTYWMQESAEAGEMGRSGNSIYLESLVELIDKYKAECGAEKVMIGGCSNGGYMTLSIARTYADKYDAYIPICEGIDDKFMTDEHINTLKDLPLYFVYSKDDTTLDPEIFSKPTIARLKEAGATNLHVSTTDHVVDLSGQYKNADGSPYQYAGHWSWIYFDNNDTSCDECEISAFEWAAQTLGVTPAQ